MDFFLLPRALEKHGKPLAQGDTRKEQAIETKMERQAARAGGYRDGEKQSCQTDEREKTDVSASCGAFRRRGRDDKQGSGNLDL